MRLLIAGMAALAALAFAAPSYAQDETPAEPTATPAPAPAAKPKVKHASAASCQKLKSASSRNTCLKKMHAHAAPKAVPATKKKKTKKATTAANQQRTVGQLVPPAATPAPAAAPPASGTVAVPPLPQKTI